MPQSRYVAYYRVSTDRQGRSGLGLDAQRRAVEDYLSGLGLVPVTEFVEVESGSRNDRPELARALHACRKQSARLIIAKLDRLARNVAFVSGLMESGVDFVACDMPTANRLTIHILAAVAEHEREMISERTRAALASAKARGTALGFASPTLRPLQKMASQAGGARLTANADDFAANVAPLINAIRARGIYSLRGIAGELNARGISARRGGSWTASSVRNVLTRTASIELGH
ncbi:recombinase family protein [Thalassobaculum sp.]|uniref:recombinase family protein n=1 Tax=Thalassobaculum sp. TaxID=2022740 RepID=UPI0032ED6593